MLPTASEDSIPALRAASGTMNGLSVSASASSSMAQLRTVATTGDLQQLRRLGVQVKV